MSPDLDVVVVGAGPNGLAAALRLAAAGLSVRVYERADAWGGGTRTAALTEPGFAHDVCSTAHPMVAISPFFVEFDLAAHGVELLQPELPFAHPLSNGRAVLAHADLGTTAELLGADGPAYRQMLAPLVADAPRLLTTLLGTFRRPPTSGLPAVLHFARYAMRSAEGLAGRFAGEEARALLAGCAAHSMMRLDRPVTGGLGLVLALLSHAVGWPVVAGGSQALSNAMVAALKAAGGDIVTGHEVVSLDELPPARATLLDVAPESFLRLAGSAEVPGGYRKAMRRFRYGPGVCKVDLALAGPMPWANPEVGRAGTVHVGGTFEQIARSEADVAANRHPEQPYVLTVQPTVADPSRAPKGRHVLWAYCHVPSRSTVDMSQVIEDQIEAVAPGFGDLIIGRHVMTAAQMSDYDPNYVGGDISAGETSLFQMLARPVPRWSTYRTPIDGVYLCSSATPPGPAVHGMCGDHAARLALRQRFGIRKPVSLRRLPTPDRTA
ncbi:MAG: NAD(P)/FAD-dependent oxidoreductase [Actinomycetota bacterium]|nr:NAD(P)/FAD-dependent oxidoreductase [Actinomycetota bacterium]